MSIQGGTTWVACDRCDKLAPDSDTGERGAYEQALEAGWGVEIGIKRLDLCPLCYRKSKNAVD